MFHPEVTWFELCGTLQYLGVHYRRDHTRLLTHALGLWTVHHCLVGCAFTINIVKNLLGCDLITSYPCTSGRI